MSDADPTPDTPPALPPTAPATPRAWLPRLEIPCGPGCHPGPVHLAGAPGAGKTILALALARRFLQAHPARRCYYLDCDRKVTRGTLAFARAVAARLPGRDPGPGVEGKGGDENGPRDESGVAARLLVARVRDLDHLALVLDARARVAGFTTPGLTVVDSISEPLRAATSRAPARRKRLVEFFHRHVMAPLLAGAPRVHPVLLVHQQTYRPDVGPGAFFASYFRGIPGVTFHVTPDDAPPGGVKAGPGRPGRPGGSGAGGSAKVVPGRRVEYRRDPRADRLVRVHLPGTGDPDPTSPGWRVSWRAA